MATKIKRRYVDQRTPEFRIYTDHFDRFLLNSDIINASSHVSANTFVWGKSNIEREIKRLETDWIPILKTKEAEIVERFNEYCDRREKSGHERPTVWPPKLLNERLEAEARTDVKRRELEFLKDKLQEMFLEPEKKVAESNVLVKGPIGVGQLRGGVLVMIDGQSVEKINETLVITSVKSPYYGMKVSDYRTHVVVPFAMQRAQIVAELGRKRADELREKGRSDIIPQAGRAIHSSSLPKWPDGVKNYLCSKNESVEKVGTSN
jgi:hypothetical protein